MRGAVPDDFADELVEHLRRCPYFRLKIAVVKAVSCGCLIRDCGSEPAGRLPASAVAAAAAGASDTSCRCRGAARGGRQPCLFRRRLGSQPCQPRVPARARELVDEQWRHPCCGHEGCVAVGVGRRAVFGAIAPLDDIGAPGGGERRVHRTCSSEPSTATPLSRSQSSASLASALASSSRASSSARAVESQRLSRNARAASLSTVLPALAVAADPLEDLDPVVGPVAELLADGAARDRRARSDRTELRWRPTHDPAIAHERVGVNVRHRSRTELSDLSIRRTVKMDHQVPFGLPAVRRYPEAAA